MTEMDYEEFLIHVWEDESLATQMSESYYKKQNPDAAIEDLPNPNNYDCHPF